ncbi:MAG: hypothetical protein ACLFRP_03880 [Puniceicoccaceae bacterium]
MRIPGPALPARALFAGCLCLVLAACSSGGSRGPAGEGGDLGESAAALRFNPNVRIGEVVWINAERDFVVVRMDAARDSFETAFLLALDPTGTGTTGFLVGGGPVEGRSFGARVLEGDVPVGAEVRMPGPEWTEYLYNRYNRSERLPGDAGRPRG